MHLGLIGGIGPASTEFYYRNLVRAHATANQALELTIVQADMRELVQNINDQAPLRQAQIFLRLAQRLQAAGAAVVAVTSIAGHFCLREFEALSPLPIINAISALETELTQRGLRRVGLLGTRIVMASQLYGGLSSIEVVAPTGAHLEATHQEYIAMATAGYATEQQRDFFFAMGKDLCQNQGAEAVILAGTDLFLAFDGAKCGFPVIDSAQVHIDALYRASIQRTSTEA